MIDVDKCMVRLEIWKRFCDCRVNLLYSPSFKIIIGRWSPEDAADCHVAARFFNALLMGGCYCWGKVWGPRTIQERGVPIRKMAVIEIKLQRMNSGQYKQSQR